MAKPRNVVKVLNLQSYANMDFANVNNEIEANEVDIFLSITLS